MNKEELEKDKSKLMEQHKKLQEQLQIIQVNLMRTEGAIAYINDNLNELEKPKEEKKK